MAAVVLRVGVQRLFSILYWEEHSADTGGFFFFHTGSILGCYLFASMLWGLFWAVIPHCSQRCCMWCALRVLIMVLCSLFAPKTDFTCSTQSCVCLMASHRTPDELLPALGALGLFRASAFIPCLYSPLLHFVVG